METRHIRNFSIIAHIDHGKSTLADRMLEITNTVPQRKMKDQALDTMELERERGITIKMTPVRMEHKDHVLNLIDTPGHIDFAYEVSRALHAVEGAVLLVDATQGVQAQTFTTLAMAEEENLTIIPVVSKIDSPLARVDEIKEEIAELLAIDPSEVLGVSGKTGEGVAALLDHIIQTVPAPRTSEIEEPRGLVFDFEYSDHRGIILYTRVFDGSFGKGEKVRLIGADETFTALEVGTFRPEQVSRETIDTGLIGYVVTGIKKPGVASVGDTLVREKGSASALPGYETPVPVVWASVYPNDADDFTPLRHALEKLRLTDSSLSFEEEASGVLGRGFRCGFLGMLHLEIITERLNREYKMQLTVTSPSVQFEVMTKRGETVDVYTPVQFPDHGDVDVAYEPWVDASVIAPAEHVGTITRILFDHEAILGNTEILGNRTRMYFAMPLRELYRNFFDELKSATSGYASLSYAPAGMREAHVTRLDVLVGDEVIPALSKVVSMARVENEAQTLVTRLHELLPRQQVAMKVQGRALGRIISSKALKAFRKDVTAGLYGGDITRKRKVLERQKKGKKRLKESARVNIPHDTFIKMMRPKD